MTGTNHATTGALIGAVVASPIIALPLAIISHFILDMLPHYGDEDHTKKSFHRIIIADTILATTILVAILVAQPKHVTVIIIAGLLGMSPDLMWLPNYIREIRNKTQKTHGRIKEFHKNIQREFTWGMIVEGIWFAIFLPVLILKIAR